MRPISSPERLSKPDHHRRKTGTMQDPEPLTQPDRERQHCFIVRVDGRLDDLIQAHRARLQKKRRARVALAEAARDLFAQALGLRGHKTPTPSGRQLGLFSAPRAKATGTTPEDELTHSQGARERQCVNCEHCGGPIPPGSRPSRRFCSGSCRVLACRARK